MADETRRQQSETIQNVIDKLREIQDTDAVQKPMGLLARSKEVAVLVDTAKTKANAIGTALKGDKGPDVKDVADSYNAMFTALSKLELIKNAAAPQPATPPQRVPQQPASRPSGNQPFGPSRETPSPGKSSKATANYDREMAQGIQKQLREAITEMNKEPVSVLSYPLTMDPNFKNPPGFKPAISLDTPASVQKYVIVALDVADGIGGLKTPNLTEALKIAKENARKLVADNGAYHPPAQVLLKDKLAEAAKSANTISAKEVSARPLAAALGMIQKVVSNPEAFQAPAKAPENKMPETYPASEQPGQPKPVVVTPKTPTAAMMEIRSYTGISNKIGTDPLVFNDSTTQLLVHSSFKKMHEMTLELVNADEKHTPNAEKVGEFKKELHDTYSRLQRVVDGAAFSANDKKVAAELLSTLDRVKDSTKGVEGMNLSRADSASVIDFAALVPEGMKSLALGWSQTDGPGNGRNLTGRLLPAGKIAIS